MQLYKLVSGTLSPYHQCRKIKEAASLKAVQLLFGRMFALPK